MSGSARQARTSFTFPVLTLSKLVWIAAEALRPKTGREPEIPASPDVTSCQLMSTEVTNLTLPASASNLIFEWRFDARARQRHIERFRAPFGLVNS